LQHFSGVNRISSISIFILSQSDLFQINTNRFVTFSGPRLSHLSHPSIIPWSPLSHKS
jgi:hypothetical protein